MRAVILAAGDGGRLGHLTTDTPKPLIPIGERRLIDYTVEGLVEGGADELLVVTGYRADILKAGLTPPTPGVTLEFAFNSRYQAGASYSLACARAFCGEVPFLLAMSDHLLSGSLVRRLVSWGAGASDGVNRVAADFGGHPKSYVDEATKLEVAAGGRVTAVGKHLARWGALDTGAFLLGPSAWEAVDASPADCELSVIMTVLAERGELFAADVTGSFWYDVDTEADLEAATAALGNSAVAAAARG